MIFRVTWRVLFLLVASTFFLPDWTLAEEAVQLKYSQAKIEDKWRVRIQSFLNKGVIPLIDLLSFLPREDSAQVIQWTKNLMDKEGVALISFAGYWAPKELGIKGHSWD